ncbi:MAG: hypothetical protein AAFQ82_17060, partial [Myxococcota bacterium]
DATDDPNRNTCSQGALNDEGRGPQSTNQCAYQVSGNELDIWVNDIFSNDADLSNEYRIRFELVGGCPTPQCNAFVCGSQ